MDSESSMKILRRYIFLIALPALPQNSLAQVISVVKQYILVGRVTSMQTAHSHEPSEVHRPAKLDELTEWGAQGKQTELLPAGKKLRSRNVHFFLRL